MNIFLCKNTSKNNLFSRFCEICSLGPCLERYRKCRAVCFLPPGFVNGCTNLLTRYGLTALLSSSPLFYQHCPNHVQLCLIPSLVKLSSLFLQSSDVCPDDGTASYIVLLSKRSWWRELARSTSATAQPVSNYLCVYCLLTLLLGKKKQTNNIYASIRLAVLQGVQWPAINALILSSFGNANSQSHLWALLGLQSISVKHSGEAFFHGEQAGRTISLCFEAVYI